VSDKNLLPDTHEPTLPVEDALGQYPPLYGIPGAADLITYIDIMYGVNNIPGKNGIIRYKDSHPHKAFGLKTK